jgi:Xanthine and CO dehydrogenases maturation factor, XdhC/CoxF family
MDLILQKLAEFNQQQKAICLCVVVSTNGGVPRHAGSKMLVLPDGSTLGTVGGGEVEAAAKEAALEAFRAQKPALVRYSLNAQVETAIGVCGGEMQVYVEPFLPRPKLLIIGAGHVGKAVARLGKFLNFMVIVSDDRAELCSPEAFPEADVLLPLAMEDIPQKLKIDSQTYIVDVSRGSEFDVARFASAPGCAAGLHWCHWFPPPLGSHTCWIAGKWAFRSGFKAREISGRSEYSCRNPGRDCREHFG